MEEGTGTCRGILAGPRQRKDVVMSYFSLFKGTATKRC